MKRILVLADNKGNKQYALQRAAHLAQASGAEIRFVGLIYDQHLSNPDLLTEEQRESVQATLLANRRDELLESVAKLENNSLTIATEVLWEKDLASWVINECSEHHYDLVLKEGHRTETWSYTPTDWQLIRDCPAPMMVIATKSWKKKARLMVTFDLGSKKRSKQTLNETLARYARDLAEALNYELHCCYAIEVPQVLSDMDLIDPHKYADNVRSKTAARLQELTELAGIPAEHTHIKIGKAAKVILSTANQLKADIVITGSSGRKGLKGRLLGNTAEETLTKLRTDIITLKP